MFIVQINKNNILDELVLVTTDLKKAQQHFLDTCSDHLSNWDKYTQADKDALLDLGYEQTGDGAIVLIDTDGITSDDAIRDELTGQSAGDMTVAEIVQDGEVALKEGMTVDEIIELCGRNLDAACSWDIQGEILFKGSDGKWYTINTESIIGVANPEWVKEVIAENKHE